MGYGGVQVGQPRSFSKEVMVMITRVRDAVQVPAHIGDELTHGRGAADARKPVWGA